MIYFQLSLINIIKKYYTFFLLYITFDMNDFLWHWHSDIEYNSSEFQFIWQVITTFVLTHFEFYYSIFVHQAWGFKYIFSILYSYALT